MLNKKERIMKAIVAELQRQYDENHLREFSRWCDDKNYDPRNNSEQISVEGNLDIGFLADAVKDIR